MIYVTGDWHLGHDKIVELAHRPTDHETQIAKNHVLLPTGSTLIHLGDVALGKNGFQMAEDVLLGLRKAGINLVACRGNHDDSYAKLLRMGFHFAALHYVLPYQNRELLFSHEPVSTIRSASVLNVHGHLHSIDGHRGSLLEDGCHSLISMELLEYRPIRLDTLLKIGATPKYE